MSSFFRSGDDKCELTGRKAAAMLRVDIRQYGREGKKSEGGWGMEGREDGAYEASTESPTDYGEAEARGRNSVGASW